MINYISTRNENDEKKTFSEVVVEGLATDGGLYVPEDCPLISAEELEQLQDVPYIGIAHRVILPFVEGCIDSDTLYQLLTKAYSNFDHEDIAPLIKLKDNIYLLELFHGPTLAFKDMALQFLGLMFDHILAKNKQNLTIVGATSGDTGSAAIEACKDKDTLELFILHPHNRVSDVQRKQMTTVLSPNIHNIAIEGSFDDCQDLVKKMFNDNKFRQEMNLSAINSINWGRIVAQVPYYVFAYLKLRKTIGSDKVAFSVPTGNFGNIYAGYIAMSMGIPVEKLIIGTNSNDILFRLMETGKMATETVSSTISPSMDIQISSNFERILFDLLGRDGKSVAQIMQHFREVGPFSLNEETMIKLRNIFTAYRFNDDETTKMIRDLYNDTDYIADPHSIIGIGAANKYSSKTDFPIISLATAHPAKFPEAIDSAISTPPTTPEKLSKLDELKEAFTVLPNDIDIVKKFIQENK